MLSEVSLHDNSASQHSAEINIKAARAKLKLTQDQLGKLLDTDGQTVRRMELSPEAKTFRKPAPRMVRLIEAYLSGYRPLDWP
jgi:DNA-binding transcriptional regulator YiaG